MPLIDPTRILNNLIVLGVLFWIFFLVWSKIDPLRRQSIVETIKGFFDSFDKKEEK